jgi:two-component system, chemotaxis family, chemotaxis protein CheV
MSQVLKNVDARTKLAGTNKLEILLFTLGLDTAGERRELFGINVFKVREVMRAPAITRAPDMPPAVEGMVSLRGMLVPVIDLAKYAGLNARSPDILIVTEYNGRTQGFLVEAVDSILRVDWAEMRVPPELIAGKTAALVTAVTELADRRLVMMLDVEQVLAATSPVDYEGLYEAIDTKVPPGRTVLFADDSAVARKQISRTLEALNVRQVCTSNGVHAWNTLTEIAATAAASGRMVRDMVQLVLTDVEMPEMDGYMLAKKIKADPRFDGVPVVMHSSLSGASNHQLGKSVGVDDYVSKLEPAKLASVLSRMLA